MHPMTESQEKCLQWWSIHHSNLSKWIVTGGSRRVPLTSTSNRITLPANRRPIQSKCSPRLLQPDCARMKQEDCLPRIFLPQHNAAYHHLRTLYLTVISGTASSQHPMISPRDLTGRIGVIMYCVLKGSIPLVADPFPPKFEFSCFVEVVSAVGNHLPNETVPLLSTAPFATSNAAGLGPAGVLTAPVRGDYWLISRWILDRSKTSASVCHWSQ
ncbi:conserved hypothetical protein [Aspergillus fumigatus A1163]|uniref:Uncharacterized protein n=1 Tax=Aspergillus fumigatus (strain CBS 144.89 / FGSC A1163 / CEA10) TaxID=451804 RepID=B0Y4U0_ASPFC|nr:conserved hypothetical protein [Aspergillus fumigatus A1163]